MISFIRGIITQFTSRKGKLAKFSATGRPGESFTDREVFQQYGLETGLPAGSECLIVKNGQNIYLIASEDRRYRIGVKDGEVALYTMEGDKIHLKKGHEIEINANNGKVIVNAGKIYLGGEELATLGGGVVTVNCPCITGGKHAAGSSSVMAKL
jgi:phage gp45-like